MLTNWMVRAWPKAARGGDRAVALAPDLPLLRVERSYVDIWSRGDLQPLNAALAAIPTGLDPDGEVTLARWDGALLARNFAAAESVVTAASWKTALTPFGTPLPKDYLLGCIALARGMTRPPDCFSRKRARKWKAMPRLFPTTSSARLSSVFSMLFWDATMNLRALRPTGASSRFDRASPHFAGTYYASIRRQHDAERSALALAMGPATHRCAISKDSRRGRTQNNLLAARALRPNDYERGKGSNRRRS